MATHHRHGVGQSDAAHFTLWTPTRPGGTGSWVFTCQCQKCPREGSVRHRARNASPIGLEKLLKRQGWQFRKGRPLCPACATAKTETNVDAALVRYQRLHGSGEEIEPMGTRKEKPDPRHTTTRQTLLQAQEDRVGDPARRPRLGVVQGVQQMTPRDQRRIIERLAECYDEEAGRYMDVLSDQLVAEELDMPRAWVEHTRDEAFSPLQGDDELDAIRAQLAQQTKELAALDQQALQLMDKLDAQRKATEELQARMEAARKRLGLAK